MMTHFSAPLRMYVSASAGVTAYIAATDTTSQHHLVMSGGGPFAFILAIGLLGGLALAGILDAVINDLLPERFSMRCTHRHRHAVFMALAIGQVALVFALAHGDEFKSAFHRYVLDAAFCVYIAIRGVRDHGAEVSAQRKKGARRCEAEKADL